MEVDIPEYMDDKSAIVDIETPEGNKHIAWRIGNKVVSFEHIPSNWPSSSICIWNSLQEYIRTIKEVGWIMEKENQKRFNIWEEVR